MRDLSGTKIGRWSVSDTFQTNSRGERKWLCRCECGTERYVLERSLLYGGSKSCGCLRKENAQAAVEYDLTDHVFGDLSVIGKATNQRKNGGVWWTCRCVCGKECDVPATLLMTGKKTSCGCKSVKQYATSDISGQRFNQLTALYPTKNRSGKGSVVWHCRCDCGNEVDVSYNELVYSNMKSCGCQKRRHNEELSGFLSHEAGTTINLLSSSKIPVNNTTGVKGVYLIRGKYTAKIVFQKKAYYLGTYERLEDAAEARRQAEEELYREVVNYHACYKTAAELDPEWAKENPMQVYVKKSEQAEFCLTFVPALDMVQDVTERRTLEKIRK